MTGCRSNSGCRSICYWSQSNSGHRSRGVEVIVDVGVIASKGMIMHIGLIADIEVNVGVGIGGL